MSRSAAFSIRRRLCSPISRISNSQYFHPRTTFSSCPARAFRRSSMQLSNGHKTYFQPGDAPYSPRPPLVNNYAANEDQSGRDHGRSPPSRGIRILMGIMLVLSSLGLLTSCYAIWVFSTNKYGFRDRRDKASVVLDIKHDESASGTTELFSLLLLNAMNPGTLYDAYRDTEILERRPLRLLDGTKATEDNATVIRMVDVLGHTRFMVLAVDTEEGSPPTSVGAIRDDGKMKNVPYSWVSQETPIQKWLLQMCQDLSQEEKAGISVMYFTRETMGLGPVGGDEEGEPLYIQMWRYDMESEKSYGNMAYGLKKIKTERLPLPDANMAEAYNRIQAIGLAQGMYDYDDDEEDEEDEEDEDEEDHDDDDDEAETEVRIDTDIDV